MVKLKYKKYIVEDYIISQEERLKAAENPERLTRLTRILRLSDDIVKGSFYMGFVWSLKPSTQKYDTEAHTHDYDEVLGFIGSDWKNPRDLGGEIEFWMEDEKYILKNSCVIFIPRGIKHCPLKDLRIDRPFLHFGMMTQGKYTSSR
jgi:hypothetical protein